MKFSGLFYSLLTALLWGMASILDKLGLAKASPIIAVTLRSLAICVASFIIIIFSKKISFFTALDLKSVIFISLAGILSGLVGQWFYFRALSQWEASRVVPVVGSYPLFAFLLSVIFLSEPITIKKIVGTIFVISGIILLY